MREASLTDPKRVLGELDRAWRQAGVRTADRRRMAAEVGPDLRAAAEDGRDPRALLTPDLETFARRVAEAGGVGRTQPHYAAVEVGAVAGGVLALVVGAVSAVFLNRALSALVDLDRDRDYSVAGPVLVFGGMAALALLGCLFGIHLALRGRSAARPTLWRAALLLPPTAGAAVAAAVAYGRSTDYSDEPAVVLTECGIILLACAASVFAARRWALSTPDDEADLPAVYERSVS